MSRIKGLNDKVTLKRKAIAPAITVWKGEKKTPKSAGKSLDSRFRIEAPASVRGILKKVYNAQEKDGSLFVETINLVPAYEDELKTFDSKMAAYTASQPLHFCDRETIHTEFIKDAKNYFQPIEAAKPCPVAGTNHKCPKGCSRTGDFYFYIWELLLTGSSEFARLQVHGVKDNQSIADILDTTKETIGAIKNSPFVSEETRTYMVYQMSRRLVKSKYPVMQGETRTDKRATKDDWIINLGLHPIWQTRYDYYQQSQQLKALNYAPSMKLIEQVYGENMIAPIPVEDKTAEGGHRQAPPFQGGEPVTLVLPSSIEKYKSELAIAYKNNAWNSNGWRSMMRDTFGTTEVTEDLDLELLMAIASSGEERDKWCEEF